MSPDRLPTKRRESPTYPERFNVGQVFFSRRVHAAPHTPLVDEELFTSVQELLVARGEDHSKRAANASDYLLAGLIVCSHCGKRFVGNVATGNRYKYRYYTCFSRQRYGKDQCMSERLPADELDQAVLRALLTTYDGSNLFERAVCAGRERAESLRESREQALTGVAAEIRKTEEAIER